MSKRPGLLDLRSDSHGSNVSSSSRPLRSPRMHIAGEAPPELSPLDAFAMQSRMLAKQLQESEKEGHRMSRLPPLTVESPLIVQGRSDYFRSMSCEGEDDTGDMMDDQGLGLRTAYEEPFGTPEERPRSMHPRMSRIPPTPDQMTQPMPDMSRGRPLNQIEEDGTYFGARRERSPSPLQSDTQSQSDKPAERTFSSRRENSLSRPSPLQIASLPGSPGREKQRSLDDLGLAPPPRSMFPKRSSSIMSSPLIPPEEDSLSSVGASFHSLPSRKLSSASVALPNQVAPSPVIGRHSHRSSSVGSDSSALPRPSFNFSRPLSRAGTPSFDPPSRIETPSRQASSDSQPSFVLADESVHTPISMHSDAFADMTAEDKPGAPSYIYSKFSLPRGKTIQRAEPSETQPQASFSYDLPMVPPSNVHRIPAGAPPSPPSRPSTASARVFDDGTSAKGSPTRPSLDAAKLSLDSSRLPSGRPSASSSRHVPIESSPFADESRGRPRTSAAHDVSRGRTPASASTSDSASTIRPPPTAHSTAPTASEMSAEEHLAKGIDCHENGSLKESTYHLRYAARQNNPTAMLLYALACRHGWGMRANQKEGVEWLRKAAEYASIEIADDEDQVKEGRHVDYVERRTRKAQFALSIYELGVSHMNGWGIDQDKSLALRCFEIAGSKYTLLSNAVSYNDTMLTTPRLGRC